MTVKSLAQKLMRATAKENQVSQIFLDYFFVAFFSIRKLYKKIRRVCIQNIPEKCYKTNILMLTSVLKLLVNM